MFNITNFFKNKDLESIRHVFTMCVYMYSVCGYEGQEGNNNNGFLM